MVKIGYCRKTIAKALHRSPAAVEKRLVHGLRLGKGGFDMPSKKIRQTRRQANKIKELLSSLDMPPLDFIPRSKKSARSIISTLKTMARDIDISEDLVTVRSRATPEQAQDLFDSGQYANQTKSEAFKILPPTRKQIKYLRYLDEDAIIPPTRALASQMISALRLEQRQREEQEEEEEEQVRRDELERIDRHMRDELERIERRSCPRTPTRVR